MLWALPLKVWGVAPENALASYASNGAWACAIMPMTADVMTAAMMHNTFFIMVVFGLFVFLFFAFWVYPVLLFLQARFPAFQAFAKIVTGKDRTKFFRVILRNAFETYFNGYVYLFENRIVTQIHRVRFSFVQPRLAWERR